MSTEQYFKHWNIWILYDKQEELKIENESSQTKEDAIKQYVWQKLWDNPWGYKLSFVWAKMVKDLDNYDVLYKINDQRFD